MRIEAFDFELPDENIALRPASPRDASLLLEIDGPRLSDHIFKDLPKLLRAGDLLVINDTKTLAAALIGYRLGRGPEQDQRITLDFNLIERLSPNSWRAFARPARRAKLGDMFDFSDDLSAEVTGKADDGLVELAFNMADAALDLAISYIGKMPLPPYIGRKRSVDDADKNDYQTLHAKVDGSVATPTAGLHFTPSVWDNLSAAEVDHVALTLHVGAGTFLPVKTDDIAAHKMHHERFILGQQAADKINETKKNGGRIIAVGTTSVRTLEANASGDGKVVAGVGQTDIFITPGYNFKIVDGLITNFHLPRSTLMMLVSALAGTENIQKAYAYAIAQQYRFYSYGDASLIWRNE